MRPRRSKMPLAKRWGEIPLSAGNLEPWTWQPEYDRFMVEATLFRGSKETWLWDEGLARATVQRHQSPLPLSWEFFSEILLNHDCVTGHSLQIQTVYEVQHDHYHRSYRDDNKKALDVFYNAIFYSALSDKDGQNVVIQSFDHVLSPGHWANILDLNWVKLNWGGTWYLVLGTGL